MKLISYFYMPVMWLPFFSGRRKFLSVVCNQGCYRVHLAFLRDAATFTRAGINQACPYTHYRRAACSQVRMSGAVNKMNSVEIATPGGVGRCCCFVLKVLSPVAFRTYVHGILNFLNLYFSFTSKLWRRETYQCLRHYFLWNYDTQFYFQHTNYQLIRTSQQCIQFRILLCVIPPNIDKNIV